MKKFLKILIMGILILSSNLYALYSFSMINKVDIKGGIVVFLVGIIICGFWILAYKKYKYVYILKSSLIDNKKLLMRLSVNDFKTKYAGSYLGITWAFIQPVVTILVYWFVFQFGLKSQSPLEGLPFVIWFVVGLVPWFFIQDAIMASTNAFVEYSYLVKKIVFQIDILPVVKIISALYVHLAFIGFSYVMMTLYGIYPSIYNVQLLYYMLCSVLLVMGIGYLVSSVYVFFKDLSQVIAIFLQVFMWMTPILWSDAMLEGKLHLIADLNPIFYIVRGYRDSLLGTTWFWERPISTLYFWLVVGTVIIVGSTIYAKLRHHFADSL